MRLKQEFVQADRRKHLVKEFDCGKEAMNVFLARFAVKHAEQGISTTMVLPIDDDSLNKLPIAAYYTLGLSTVRREEIPSSGFPRYEIPVTLLARLAVDVNFKGKKLGTKSLIYALRHAAKLINQGLPTVGLILDVLDNEALFFYQSFKFFVECTNNPMRLYISRKELEKI